jgi:hypothetical protein
MVTGEAPAGPPAGAAWAPEGPTGGGDVAVVMGPGTRGG